MRGKFFHSRSHFLPSIVSLTAAGLIAALVGLSTACATRPSDETIAKSIQKKISEDPQAKGAMVQVAVTGGKVTLTGNATTGDAQQAVQRIARLEPGVTNIEDSTTVPPVAGQMPSASAPPLSPVPAATPPAATPPAPVPAPANASAPSPAPAPTPANPVPNAVEEPKQAVAAPPPPPPKPKPLVIPAGNRTHRSHH